jgi:2-polyprenyl-3-methyl-5-hydroxy-6-metoxy-1,4-benzoquinol methylase
MFSISCNKRVAVDSPDHTDPLGTINDNSKNYRFNTIVANIIETRPIKIIDIGCAGGGLIEDFVMDGHLGVGLEGSDLSFVLKRAAWKTIPNNLFVCDVSEDYQIYHNEQPFVADVISAWEFMEHPRPEQIDSIIRLFKKHLKLGGYFIGSISTGNINNEKWHQTVKDKSWWLKQFANYNFIEDTEKTKMFADGNGWVRQQYDSFNIVMKSC